MGPIKNFLSIYNSSANMSHLEAICTKEEIEVLKAQLEQQSMNIKWNMLKPKTDLVETLKYVVGTFLAEDAIDNLKHEEALKILDTITQGEYSLYEVLEMQGLISPSGKQQDKPQQKEKIDDKNDQNNQ